MQWPQAATLHLRFSEEWPLPGGRLEVVKAQLCKDKDGMSGRGDPEFQKDVAAILVSAAPHCDSRAHCAARRGVLQFGATLSHAAHAHCQWSTGGRDVTKHMLGAV